MRANNVKRIKYFGIPIMDMERNNILELYHHRLYFNFYDPQLQILNVNYATVWRTLQEA